MITAEEIREITNRAREKDLAEKISKANEFLNSHDFEIMLLNAANCCRGSAKIKIPEEYICVRSAITEELGKNGFGIDWEAKNIMIVRW